MRKNERSRLKAKAQNNTIIMDLYIFFLACLPEPFVSERKKKKLMMKNLKRRKKKKEEQKKLNFKHSREENYFF